MLSGTGNLRALVTGLILTIVAQASLRGVLSPARETLSELWTVQGGPSRNLLSMVHAGPWLGAVLGLAGLVWAFWLARRARVGIGAGLSAVGVGLAVFAGWLITYVLSQHSFKPITIKSVSFTGPSADTLMGLINSPSVPLGFDTGLVPGVFAGALVASLIGARVETAGISRRPQHATLRGGSVPDGFRRHAGRRLRGRRRRHRRCDLCRHRLARAGFDVGRRAGHSL